MRLELPYGATVGSIISVTYRSSEALAVDTTKPWDGKIVAMDAPRVTVRFDYKGKPSEYCNLNLDTGMDETWGALIEEISAGGPQS